MKRGFLLAFVIGGLLLIGLLLRRSSADRTASSTTASTPSATAQLTTNRPASSPSQNPVVSLPPNRPPVSVGATTNHPTPFTAFADWAQRRLTNDPTADIIRGEALAWKRHEAMLDLIEADPERALQLAAPFAWHRALPQNVTRHFEQWMDARGDFEVAMAESATEHREIVYRWAVLGGQRYRAFVHGRRLAQISQQNIPLHGIALADKIALTTDPIRLLDVSEAEALEAARAHATEPTCAVCGRQLLVDQQAGDIGGETRWFCGAEHAALANESLTLAAYGGSGSTLNVAAGGSSAWTQGRKDVLYVRVNFPDDLSEPNSETAAYNTMAAVNAYYVENSYNQTWLDTTVTPLLTLPQIKAWYATAGPGALLSDARTVARKAGFDTANYDRDIVSHTSVPGFDWGGLGMLGAKGTWLQGYGIGVTVHELGHNAGLPHANFWEAYSPYTGIYGAGTNIEYGNSFDSMGSSGGGGHFGAMFKHQLDWLPDTAVHAITTNGVYRIYPFDTSLRTSGRFYAARVRKDFERDYWLEFRNRLSTNSSFQNGLLLNWTPWSGGGGSGLVDAYPATDSRSDAPVVIGRTFSDRIAGVHITPLARGATGPEPWIDVQVNFDDDARNIPCCLKVEVSPTNATPGQLVRLHATVADRDDNSFAYTWSFDDVTFSTNNSSWTTKSWAQSGEHVVRCEVSDLRGGRASATAVVTVGTPMNYRLTGSVLDEAGNPLEDVFVNPNYTNANGAVLGFTDSYGTFVLTGVDGSLDLQLAKYGYTFEPAGWMNPFFVTSNTVGVGFIARAMTNITLTISNSVLVENIATNGVLILTRSGGTNDDLSVPVFLSGSAGIPSDLTFAPPLAFGSNNVVIPAGTNRAVFTFAPVNNGTVEPTEVLNISVRETADFVLTTRAEQRITILDDDQAAPPAVSIATLDGPVLEPGMNPAGFVVTRLGSTAADLPVTYSVGGTATPGADYATLLGTAIIPAGSTSVKVELRPLDDKEVEPNETVALTISASPTYTITTGSATATILDDDLLVVTVSPTGSGLAEPNGSGSFTFQRDGDITSAVVIYYTVAGSASNGVDYATPSGSVTIAAGATAAEVAITALNDALIEGDETVTLVLTTNAAYDIGTPGSATLTLRDDERVTVTVAAPDGAASEPGSNFGEFIISRNGSASGNLSVNFAINGTALPGVDYVPLENPVVIPDGSSSVTLTLIPFEDLFLEPIETVSLTLIASTNYNLGSPAHATVEIEDNDFNTPAVGFAFPTLSVLESESPGLPVALSHTSTAPVSVQYQVIGGTATPGTDYTLAAGTLDFEPGEWAKSIPLTINNDTQVESDETIRVTLFNPTAAAHDGIQIMTYTIRDDDASAVSVAPTAATASEAGPVAASFRLTRTGGTNHNQLVNFQITGTASAPSDCPALGTSVTIPAGATFVDLTVVPVDDGTVELDEDLTLTLISAPTGKIVAPNVATITILDANTNNLPTITLTATNQPNAVEGGGNGAFTLTRTGPTTNPLTVYLATSGTATSGADYTALPDSVTFAIGQSALPITVVATDDTAIEGEETVIVALTTRDTYRVAHPGTSRVMIQDNDQSVRLDASDFDAAEPGLDRGEFTFTRFGTTNTPVQVFFTISGTAGNGTDYAAISNSFTIPAGSLTATLPITPLNDALFESREQVTLTLQANAAYTVGTPNAATVTIRDDEPTLSLTANVTEIPEASPVPAILTVRREGDPDREFIANLAIGGTAAFGVDYPAFETNILFSCGIVAVDLLVSPTNEALPGVEFMTATLLPSPSYSRTSQTNVNLTIVEAGLNHEPIVTITSPTTNVVYLQPTSINMILEATATDADGTTLTLEWSKVSGPNAAAFSETTTNNTTVSLTNSGVYVLRLSANDGALTSYDEVTVVVGALERLTNNPAGEELLHWTFDEGSGPGVADTSGHARHGAIQGPPGWITNGVSGGALNLSGTNNFVAATNNAEFLNGLSRFTLSCWIKPNGTPATRGLFTADDSGLATLTLALRQSASCGSAPNVIESTFATSCGDARQISSANTQTNGWQHLALTWTNGFAPLLYLNGKLDQANRHKAPLVGELVNCPQFLLGKGPADLAALWAGAVDELRVFSWQMDAAEVGTFVAGNFGPSVAFATNLVVPVVIPVELHSTASVTDDGHPKPPGFLAITWMQREGPLPVTLQNSNLLPNTVTFTQAGDYLFRLIVDDGQVKIFDDLTVTVVEPTPVMVYASDGFAAEFGPDPGEFTFSRAGGDLSFALTVYYTQSGTASNGADFVQLPLTNSLTFPVDVDTLTVGLTPFLDHRTEGDETFSLTLVSNVLYTISSGEATVLIQDSPYGIWNIANFTLEELTDPLLSGETADYDDDGLINFVEYAANRTPKSPETNAPLQATLELDPGDNKNHVTFTYQRWLPPTDVAYAAAYSTDLLTWQTNATVLREISATPDPAGRTETVKVQVVAPWPETSPQYVTVRVWLLSTGP